ncbi:MAG: Fe-S cluster assembly ATPase SufC [Bacteroidales bacterium]|nr:Fe-S cluster assembly ATPase SufC [Bacteroidales bacterium]
MALLTIRNLHASIGDKEILKGVDLEINRGEVHAIMGPNGNGKSTLAGIVAGNPKYTVTQGEVLLNGQNILEWPVDKRAAEGIFLGFQYPVEIPGVSITNFMRTAVNEQRKYHGKDPLSGAEFLKLMNEKKAIVEMTANLANRSVNEGFSGGEKKKNEIFQMAMLNPTLSFLDETDSGLDIDALRIVASGVNQLRSAENATVVITHYQRLLDYIVPDFVHVLYEGRIVKTGPKELALKLEELGYDWIKEELEAKAAK